MVSWDYQGLDEPAPVPRRRQPPPHPAAQAAPGLIPAMGDAVALTHRQLIDQIAALAQARRLQWHYCPDSRRCLGSAGFPDLLIGGPRGIILAEIKTADDDTSAEQDLWAFTLAEASRNLYALWPGTRLFQIWREADLEHGPFGRIALQLDSIAEA